MNSTRQQLQELLRIIARTEPREINCEEFLARVGAYLEQLEPSATPSEEFKLVSQHLDVCPECREEFDALWKIYGDTRN